MNRKKKILLGLLLVFIAIQFIRPARNNSNATQHGDIIAYFNVPANVAGIFQTSCYDCHSNNTRYLWYANIQPFGWLLAKHIKDGKAELNFNEYRNYSPRRQLSKLKSTQNSIKDGSMPLSSYTLLHPNAKLSEESMALLIEWTTKTVDSLSSLRN
ncbi:MAG: heme-binding domain-containing protein [Chitinophagaceae bacterium]